MKFYTRCDNIKGYYHIRGYDNGKPFHEEHKVKHFHYEVTAKETNSPLRTMDGKKVVRRDFENRAKIDRS